MVQIIPLIIKLVSYIHYLVNLVKYHWVAIMWQTSMSDIS
jgi:hypothetical protein